MKPFKAEFNERKAAYKEHNERETNKAVATLRQLAKRKWRVK